MRVNPFQSFSKLLEHRTKLEQASTEQLLQSVFCSLAMTIVALGAEVAILCGARPEVALPCATGVSLVLIPAAILLSRKVSRHFKRKVRATGDIIEAVAYREDIFREELARIKSLPIPDKLKHQMIKEAYERHRSDLDILSLPGK